MQYKQKPVAENRRIGTARFWGVIAIIVAGALLRLIPHLPNFSPVAAMALFGGAFLDDKRVAVLVPLAVMFLSDCVLGFHALMPAVYVSFVLVAGLGFWLKTKRTAPKIAVASLIGSLVFFIVTNFAVWTESGMYPHTFDGLVRCYVAALPFLQNSLAGDFFFATILFGAWALAEFALPALRGARIREVSGHG